LLIKFAFKVARQDLVNSLLLDISEIRIHPGGIPWKFI
jgi:hypothetical protein